MTQSGESVEMKRSWLLALAVATLGSLVLVVFFRPRAPERAFSSPSTLGQEVQALRGEVGKLRANAQPKIYIVPSERVEAAATTSPAASASIEQPPERTPEQRQKDTAEELQTKFESEAIDGAWSVAMVREIREAMSSAAPAAHILQASCATSLCRIVLGHDAEDDQRGLGQQVAGAKPFREGVFYDYDLTPTALKTTLFVARQGYSFRD